jgi:hypothetical protein
MPIPFPAAAEHPQDPLESDGRLYRRNTALQEGQNEIVQIFMTRPSTPKTGIMRPLFQDEFGFFFHFLRLSTIITPEIVICDKKTMKKSSAKADSLTKN